MNSRRRVALGLALGAALATPAAAGAVTIDLFPLDPGDRPLGIAADASGDLWVAASGNDALVRVAPDGAVRGRVELAPGTRPRGITVDAEAVWATGFGSETLVRVAGATVATVPRTRLAAPAGVAPAGEGSVWATRPGAIALVKPDGGVTQFTRGMAVGALPIELARAGDLVWFTDLSGAIGHLDGAGTITETRDGLSPGAEPWDITAGPDGRLWFTERVGPGIGRVDPDGSVHELPDVLPEDWRPGGIALGPDGNLWVTDTAASRIARVAPDGSSARVLPTGQRRRVAGQNESPGQWELAPGPDGTLWFTGDEGTVGRIRFTPELGETRATLVDSRAASIVSQVTTFGHITGVSVEYGTSPALGSSATSSGGLGPSATPRAVLVPLDGLRPDTTYFAGWSPPSRRGPPHPTWCGSRRCRCGPTTAASSPPRPSTRRRPRPPRAATP